MLAAPAGPVGPGVGVSASAGAVLMVFQDMSPTALVGVASAIGILGQSALEAILQKLIGRIPNRSEREEGENK
ncbi:hypothetical protein [Paraburkholderia sp.]|uniref:hypothetical protein n=1 Tax=Paraburkholderia sp. TaxID=1926495 RepID=UPI003C7E035E